MNDSPPSGPRSPDPFPTLRVVALIAAILGVLVLLAAAFVLSYPGIHQLARTAGMSVTLARVFPVIFDALLVVAIASVLSLHGAGWWRRGYSWLITLLLLAAMAAGGVLHAVHPQIPHRAAAVTAAVLPWALLLIAFSLLLSMLRQFRQPRVTAVAGPAAPAAAPAETRIGLDGLLSGSSRIAPAQPSRADVRTSTVPITVPGHADPGRTEAAASNGTAESMSPATRAGHIAPPGAGAADGGAEQSNGSRAKRADTAPADAAPAGAAPGDTKPAEAQRADTGPAEAERADIGPADTEPADTASADSAPSDTGPASAPDRAKTEPAEAGPAATQPDETLQDEAEPEPALPADADRPDGPGAGASHVPQQPIRAPVPAPSPHFDRLRSTPTPPEDDTDPDA